MSRNETQCIEKIFFETMPAKTVTIVENLGEFIVVIQWGYACDFALSMFQRRVLSDQIETYS